VPLIQDELKAGDAAGMAHYHKAGEMLLEAKVGVKHGEWTDWLREHFHLSQTSASVYMKLAKEQINTPSINFKSLNEFKSEHLGYKQTVHPSPWHEPVKQAMADPSI
jgi:hypothetical protein